MYKYSEFDHAFIAERNRQFRTQVAHRLNGTLTEDEFKPLRLMNGVYLQLHAYMLRVAIPYGTLNSTQMNALADIAERWDKGYGHFTTRQNIQFNWPKLSDIPDILDHLATVEMHALQTSGNTIRNVTTDHFAGAAKDELFDPRPYAELIRQWSTDHPEFQFMPRKFKIAITASPEDRAVTKAHDIGLRGLIRDGQIGFQVIVGGGLGRTPMVGKILKEFIPINELLPYLEATVSVWNLLGRRDNKYKARIKITVHEHGIEDIRARVEDRFNLIKLGYGPLDLEYVETLKGHFSEPAYDLSAAHFELPKAGPMAAWIDTNTHAHKQDAYVSVSISLKKHGDTPGDASARQMRKIAELAKHFAHDEIRISHEQNVILPHVPKRHLAQIYEVLRSVNLHTANIGLISDIIACPGMDYCALATARSIPIAQQIAQHFDALKLEHDIGPMKIKISGCINACGHHHVGHIGILGLDRAGVENYQITLGGDGGPNMTLGDRMGPGFSAQEVIPAIERIVFAYLDVRQTSDETFLDCYRRVGSDPFKTALYHASETQAAE